MRVIEVVQLSQVGTREGETPPLTTSKAITPLTS